MRLVQSGDVDKIQGFLDSCPDVFSGHFFPTQMFAWAIPKEDEAVIKLLIERGAFVDRRWVFAGGPDPFPGLPDSPPYDFVHEVVVDVPYLSLAAYYGKAKALDSMLRLARETSQTVTIDQRDGTKNENSPLMWAVDQGHADCATILLDHDANVNFQNAWRDTPLIVAARRNNADMVKLLLAHGANKTLRKDTGQTAEDVATDPAIKQLISDWPQS